MMRETWSDRSVDSVRTGANLRLLVRESGWDVRKIQRTLYFLNRNSVYDWFGGRSIPTVDHLLALAYLLGCPIETLLVRYDHVSPLQETAYLGGRLLLGFLRLGKQGMRRILIYGAKFPYPLETENHGTA